jgi:hypothetical protein
MASTYSPILRTELIGSGDQAGIWGSTTNSNFQYIFEAAIAGYVAVTVSPTSNNQVLTYVNGPSASAALDQSVYAILKLNAGTLGDNFNIFAPPVSKTYVVWNNTAYTASFYNSTVIGNTTAAGSAVVIPAGAKVVIWSDGASFYGNDTAVGNFNVGNNLTVNNSTTLNGNTSLAGNLAVTGTSSYTGNATFGGTLGVTGTTTLSGTSTAPTPSYPDNTTKIATTAYVTTAIAGIQPGFSSGTTILFYQASAPTGWTQVTALNDYALRLVSGTGGSTGGTTAFSTVFTNQTPSFTGSNGSLGVNAGSLGTGSTTQGGSVFLSGGGSINGTTLSVGQLASHGHSYSLFSPNGQGNDDTGQSTGNSTGSTTGAEGGNESHSHGFNNPSYGFSGDSHSHSISGSPSLSGTISGSNGPITLNVRYANIIICTKN